MKKLLIITLIFLSSCGSISKLHLSHNQEIAKIDFAKYQKIIILDFVNKTNKTLNTKDGKAKITQILADKIYHNLQDSTVFENKNIIKTKSKKFIKKGNLIISGNLTRIQEGNDILRGIFGLLGRSRLVGQVNLIDGHTKKVIAKIDINKASLAYGLFIAANQDLQYLLNVSAKIIVKKLEDGQI